MRERFGNKGLGKVVLCLPLNKLASRLLLGDELNIFSNDCLDNGVFVFLLIGISLLFVSDRFKDVSINGVLEEGVLKDDALFDGGGVVEGLLE